MSALHQCGSNSLCSSSLFSIFLRAALVMRLSSVLACGVLLFCVHEPLLVLAAPHRTRRQVEKQSFLGFEKPESPSLNVVQKALYNYLEPKPIVDTIQEHEKYGNEGDVLGSVGRGIVTGTESFTTFLSSAVSVPGNVARRLLRRVSESLNNVGSRLVGL
ncbi:hypothetical protein B566_EDAN002633 [Ephemera danica]|nr:hypothetical protein B566_EDAN002633 [Ephemera danica]